MDRTPCPHDEEGWWKFGNKPRPKSYPKGSFQEVFRTVPVSLCPTQTAVRLSANRGRSETLASPNFQAFRVAFFFFLLLFPLFLKNPDLLLPPDPAPSVAIASKKRR